MSDSMNRARSPTAIAATKAIKPALMACGMVAVAAALPLLGAASAQATLANLLAQGGFRGPAMFLLAATFLTAIGLPRQVPAFIAGYAFGPWYGTVIALVSQVMACSLTFIWARAVGRNFISRYFGKVLRQIDTTLAAQPFIATLTLRVMPVGSNILLNLAAGLSSIPAVPFLAASAIGFIPQTLIFAVFGQGSAPTHAHMLMLGGAMFIASATLGMLLLRRSRRIAA